MKPFWERIEHYNNKLIPYALVILLVVILVELFGEVENPTTHLVFEIVDYLVILIFVIDLIFLAIKAKSVSFFFKHYWLDLLAVIPVGLIFAVVSRFYRGVLLTEELVIGQKIVHETLEAEKELKEASYLAKEGKLARGVRIFVRSIRAVTKSRLFTHFEKKKSEAHKKVYGKKK
ncbi:hypothetical protein HYX13_04615 [Candidatus Woesearchaeota archaeon]|nr:hypothetical protein [Candidatus Woesearchaeota archaeon]